MPLKKLIWEEQPILPNSLVPYKDMVVSFTDMACKMLFGVSDPWKKLLTDTNWTTWSPPDELYNQFLEWEPLTNIRHLTLNLSDMFPQLSFHYLFFLTLMIIISLMLMMSMFNHLLSLTEKRELELKFLFSLTSNKKKLFPSPNYKQDAKLNGFGPLLGWLTPCFIKTIWHPVKTGFMLLLIMISMLPLLMYMFFTNKYIIVTWDIFLSPSSPLSLSFLLDMNGLLLMATVMFIASNVMFFAATYMSGDLFMPRFISLVISFVLAMCLLVVLPNMLTILIGWDGLGLSSYLLVLYYQTPKSQGAAMITAMTNRLGDTLILFIISWSINTHWLPLFPWSSPSHSLVALMLIMAAMTKSAQYPFISWLPAAMAAPTPVSALVHSSTLVTAGVFILVRFFKVLQNTQSLEFLLLFSACLTTLIAGLSALAECDMKKIIALSTLSQLGTMVFSLAMGVPQITFFHLITHALFKALLFMTAGVLIHFHHHTQDLRSYGFLGKSFPFLTSMMIVSNFALTGMPFTAGFYSKDLIIETMVSDPISYLLILLFTFATSLTSMYTIRFMMNTSWAPRNTAPLSLFQRSINLLVMMPMFNLSQATLIMGGSLTWLMIFPASESTLPLFLKLQAMFALTVGASMGTLISIPSNLTSGLMSLPKMNEFLTSMAFSTPINSQLMARIPLYMGHSYQKSVEGGWMEIMGGQGVFSTLTPLSQTINMSLGKSLSVNIVMALLFFTTFTLILI